MITMLTHRFVRSSSYFNARNQASLPHVHDGKHQIVGPGSQWLTTPNLSQIVAAFGLRISRKTTMRMSITTH